MIRPQSKDRTSRNCITIRTLMRSAAQIEPLGQALPLLLEEFLAGSRDADLERSFGPVYARGVLRRGTSAFAILGVNASETQAAIDSSVAFGVLWLDHCREQLAARAHVEGLKLFVPRGTCEVAAARMAA